MDGGVMRVTQLEARVMGPDGIATLVVGVFGKPRTSAAALVPQQPAIERPARPFEMKYVPGLFPAFLQHFNARWPRGKPPFSGSTDPVQIVEIDLDDGAPGEAHAIAADFPPPIGLTLARAGQRQHDHLMLERSPIASSRRTTGASMPSCSVHAMATPTRPHRLPPARRFAGHQSRCSAN
jgi:hypothetical protein